LTQRGLVFRVKPFTHSYPHCWRCSTPLYYCALPAWFINIQKIKPALLKENKEVSWYPEHLKEGRFQNSVQQAPDWNISRNRFWATALPFWRCEQNDCRKTLCVGSVEELIEKSSNFREVYPEYNGEVSKLDLHKPYIDAVIIPCSQCGGRMTRVPEVVDCWVESASMPFAEIHYPFEEQELFKHRAQADFVAEYIAQTRAWFYVMHVLGVTLFEKAPFKNVVTTGTILAEDGAKMSKSLNNYPDPWVLIDKYGMDAIRFYLMQSPVMNGDDFNFSEAGVKEVSQKVNMLLYNVWSFYRMYSAEKLQPTAYHPQPIHVLDRWVLERLKQMIGVVTYQLDHYNTPRACRELVEFINELSTWYVRRSRDRIKANDESSTAALQTLGYVLARTCQVLAPIAPFVSDYIYRDVTGEESVHVSAWPEAGTRDEGQGASVDVRILEQMNLVRELVSVALAGRKAAAVSVRQPLRALAYQTQSTDVRLSDEHLAIVLEELNVKLVDDYEQLAEWSRTRGNVHTSVGGGKVSSVLLDLELNEELRLEGYARELERAVQDLRKKSGLTIGEEIELYYNTQDEDIEKV
ncbi:MAG: class I tRNA ligase family protein, partial [Candidatus Doudnabacteria bacterium]|nr:class I tRNA ligase family protein [Candidatus Doudnabacteria bacterium]